MKPIFEKIELSTSGKILLISLTGLLRALGVDGATSTGALPVSVLDNLRIGLVSPNRSGEVTLKTDSKRACYYSVVDGNELHVSLSRLCAGNHRLSVYAQYGTQETATLVVELIVPSNIPYLLADGTYTPLVREESKDENGYKAYVYPYGDVVVWLEGGLDFNHRVTAFVADGLDSTLENATEENDCQIVKDADVAVYDEETDIEMVVVDSVEKEAEAVTHSVFLAQTTGGRYKVDGAFFDEYDNLVEEGTSLEVEAVPNSGFEFLRWSDGLMSAKRTIVVDDDKFLEAKFEEE